MDAAAFIADLRARKFTLRADGHALYVEPRGALTPGDVARIKETKAAILKALTMPSLRDGSLHIGFDCDELFHWWKPEGQSIAQTLADLDAPADVVRRYLGKSDKPLHTALGVRDCKGEIVTLPELAYCVGCGWCYETPVVNELAEYLGF